MELIYNNFDALDVTFQGALPEKVLNQLAKAREQAQNEKREVYVELGFERMPVMVAETGARGGYRYRFDTGMDGEIWFIAHSTNSKMWNIRVSVKSLALSLSGYKMVKNRLLKRLKALSAHGPSRHDSGNGGKPTVINTPLESISRFDYCFDFVMDSAFMPLPCRFIAHQRAKKHVYGEHGVLPTYSSLNGERVNTIRIGELPGRQAVIYNKTKEIIASSKRFWWDIWGVDSKPFKQGFKQIWRIEVRAGKNELNKWGLKHFKDFEDKAGDVVAAILKAIRYSEPLKDDLNRSRWPMHPIWAESLKTSYKALAPYSTNAIRENVIRDYRENIINGYKERLIGNLIGLIAAQERDISEIPITIEELENDISTIAEEDITILLKKFEKAEEKFKFLS